MTSIRKRKRKQAMKQTYLSLRRAVEDEEEEDFKVPLLLNHSSWFIKLIAFQADLLTNSLITLFSPFFTLVSESFHQAGEAKESFEETVVAATRVPSKVAHGGVVLLRKVGFGCLGAFYACIILMAVLILSVVVGVGLVQFWAEEPISVHEPVHFDYTQVHPTAVFPLPGGKKRKWTVPVGHTYFVTLVLLMPDSDFNRHIGVFQVTAEVISTTGHTLAISRKPCMLRFRSHPVRLMHTLMMSVPLLLGISEETQKITVQLLKHKEEYPRTATIRATLQPRAGTSSLPQIYSSEILINSQLPFMKQLVRDWKWTLYVWTSMYVYVMLLVIVVCFCSPVLFATGTGVRDQGDRLVEEVRVQESRVRRDSEAMESLERWRRSRSRIRSRSKRKAAFSHEVYQEVGGPSASSSGVVSREDPSEVVDDFGGFTDAESVCQGG